MKILVLTNMYPNEHRSFYGVFVKDEIEALKRRALKPELLFINGRRNRLHYLSGLVRLVQVLSSGEYDLIHAHHTYCAFLALVARPLAGKRIPLILTLHEGEIFHKTDDNYEIDRIRRFQYNTSLRQFVMQRLSFLITVNKDLINGFRMRDYSVIPCGVDLERFRPFSREDSRKETGIAKNARVVFFPSDYRTPAKRFDLVEEAYRILQREYNGTLHLIRGGEIPPERMPVYYNASDVVVLASDYEASPMVVKEAMAVNVPVVTVNAGDAVTLISGVEGCYQTAREPGDIACNIRRALDFGARTKGREKIRQLQLSHHDSVYKVIRVYERVLSGNASPAPA
ncbi:MAG: glycosyltransferase [Candidatus Omnitrophica bacterium]|nr:glycosyltransferase [Candidatus Omnitrophota bacterium]